MNCQHIGDESNTAVSGRDGRQEILPEQQRTKQQRRSDTIFEKMGADRRYLRQFGAPAIDVGLIEVALAGAGDLGCQMAVLLGQIGVTRARSAIPNTRDSAPARLAASPARHWSPTRVATAAAPATTVTSLPSRSVAS